jgi:hypothetical protein
VTKRKTARAYLPGELITAASRERDNHRALWGLMLASVAFNTLETAGTIAWATAKQNHVPTALLGRVSSLDWLISIAELTS